MTTGQLTIDPRQQALAEQAVKIMRQAQRQIWVTFQREGIHKYPAAATDPNLATGDQYDVSFLAHPHRHVFHFRVWINVWHNDRDIEFIQFKRWLESLYSDSCGVLELDHKSCEMIADDLYTQITSRYPGRDIWIEVSEDGENGCLIKYQQPKNHSSPFTLIGN
jgi:hypothetical protein